MQITLSFEAHELPAMLAQLVRVANGDVGDLVSEIMRHSAQSSQPAHSAAEAQEFPHSTPAEAESAPSFFATEPATVVAGAPQVRTRGPRSDRGVPRGSRTKGPAPHTSAVNPADLPPAAVSAFSPTAVAAVSPAPQMPPAAVAQQPLPPSHTAVAPPQPAAGGYPTDDDLRAAYVAANSRGAEADGVMAIMANAKVTRLRDVPGPQRHAVIAALNALSA